MYIYVYNKTSFPLFFSSFCHKIDKPKKDNSMSSPFSYGGIMHHTLCYTSRFLDTKFFYNRPSRKVAIANSAWKQCQSMAFISRDRVLSTTYFLPCYASFITPLWGQNLSYTWLWIFFSFWTIIGRILLQPIISNGPRSSPCYPPDGLMVLFSGLWARLAVV